MTTVYFHTAVGLSLNMSFRQIKIGYMDLYGQHIGKVTIKSELTKGQAFFGVMTCFKFYPPGRIVQMVISAEYTVYWNVDLFFSIIDTKVIFNIPSRQNRRQSQKWTWYFKKQNIISQRYLFTTNKFCKTIISAESFDLYMSVKAHDGPGELSNLLTPFQQPLTGEVSFVASTFQCLLILILQFFEAQNVTVKFHGQAAQTYSNTKHIELKTNNVTVILNQTTEMCKKLASLRFVSVSMCEGCQGNITIASFEIHARKLSTCIFCDNPCSFVGIAFYEYHFTAETFLVCHSEAGYQHRPFYFNTSAASLVLYSHTEYIDFVLTLELSVTNCKVIPINVCIFSHYCQFSDPENCKFLSTLPNFKSACLTQEGGNPCINDLSDLLHQFTTITVQESSCTVLQLNHKMKLFVKVLDQVSVLTLLTSEHFKPGLCHLKYLRIYVNSSKSVIQHICMTGFLSGK